MASPPKLCLDDVVQAAVLAPSPDNNQPWRFVTGEHRLWIHPDPQRALPSDAGAMFMMLALGAAAENACIAARQMGYEGQVTCHSNTASAQDKSNIGSTVEITFTDGGEPDPLHGQLAQRCTCRKLYSSHPISERSLRALSKSAHAFGGVQVNWATDRRRIRALGWLIAASDRIRFEHRPFHEELYKQLRFTPQEVEQTRDGLDLRTLELPLGAGLLLRSLRSWRRMKIIHDLGFGRLLTLPSAVAVWKSGALGAMTVKEASPKSYLQAGRAFQRLWLTAQAEGIALQPLGSLPIFLSHVKQLGGTDLKPGQCQRIKRLDDRLRELFPATSHDTMVMLFRIGYSTAPSYRSLRRSLSVD